MIGYREHNPAHNAERIKASEVVPARYIESGTFSTSHERFRILPLEVATALCKVGHRNAHVHVTDHAGRKASGGKMPCKREAVQCRRERENSRPHLHGRRLTAATLLAFASSPCAAAGASRASESLRLLVGVQSTPQPRSRRRRDAIRASWKRWAAQERGVTVCFVIGRRGLSPRQQADVELETKQHDDLLLLDVRDGSASFPAAAKMLAWWRWAASRLLPPPSASGTPRPARGFAVKTEEDVFIHLPHLHSELLRLRCHPLLFSGQLAYSGYNPVRLSGCGWSWTADDRNYRLYGCWRSGHHPPVPFVNGQLEVLSAALAHLLATSAEAAAFVERASERETSGAGTERGTEGEDVILGWIASRLQGNVTYVGLDTEGRARLINLACARKYVCMPPNNCGLYQTPNRSQLAVHWVKQPEGQAYLWRVFHDGDPHEPAACQRAAGTQ